MNMKYVQTKEKIMPDYNKDYSLPKYSHTGGGDIPSFPSSSKATSDKNITGAKKSSKKKAPKSKKSSSKGGDMEY